MAVGDIDFEISAGRAGHINMTAPYRVLGSPADEDMEAGRVVCVGANPGSCALPADAADVGRSKGVVVYHPFRYAFGANEEEVAAGQVADLLEQGEVWVQVEDAVTEGEPVYVRHTADGGLDQLGVCFDGTGTGLALLPNARFASSAAAAGIARVRINLPG